VRKAKSKTANIYAPLNIINFIAYKEGENLSRIKEANFNYVHNNLTTDVIKSSVGVFMVDLARNAIKEKEKNLELYEFLKFQLMALDQEKLNIKYTPIFFTIQLSQYLGFALDNNYTSEYKFFDLLHGTFIDNNIRHNNIMDEESSIMLTNILNGNIDIAISKDERNRLLDFLIEYYKLHIEGFLGLKSLSVIRQIHS